MKKPHLLVIAAIAVIALPAFSLGKLVSAKRELSSLKTRHEAMLALRDKYVPLREKVRSLESRKGLTKAQGVVQALDEVIEPLGLKDRIKSVKPLSNSGSDPSEERAEVNIKGVTLNETTNALYNIENAPMLLVIRKINMKTSFDKPDLLDITMTVSFIKPGQ